MRSIDHPRTAHERSNVVGAHGELVSTVALINAAAGERGNADRVALARSALSEAGVVADVRTTEGADMEAAARVALASGADLVIAGGGDGTVSAVASVLA